MNWTRAELRTNGINGIRELTGMKSTSKPTDTELNAAINDFYLQRFVHEVKPEELAGDFQQSTAATDPGEYSLAATIALLAEPVLINGVKVTLYTDRAKFFKEYPSKKGSAAAYAMTAATLSIGVSATTSVTNAAFSYRIGANSYSKATAETALSGDTVPQSKYGAWRLEVDAAGTISIVAADDNATGYDTAALAIADIENESADGAPLGFVTAIDTGAAFVPGTTSLSTGGNVTATYTDGFHTPRGRPESVLLDRRKLYARPIPNDIFVIEATKYSKPAELDDDTDTVQVPEWGPVIAHGTAIELLAGSSDNERIAELQAAYVFYKGLVERRDAQQSAEVHRTMPAW